MLKIQFFVIFVNKLIKKKQKINLQPEFGHFFRSFCGKNTQVKFCQSDPVELFGRNFDYLALGVEWERGTLPGCRGRRRARPWRGPPPWRRSTCWGTPAASGDHPPPPPAAQRSHLHYSSILLLWHKVFLFLSVVKWCCYITVDSSTSALQNGACTYQCISKQMHYKNPFHTTATWKAWNFMKNTSLCSIWKKTNFLKYYIKSQLCMAYYPKWLK